MLPCKAGRLETIGLQALFSAIYLLLQFRLSGVYERSIVSLPPLPSEAYLRGLCFQGAGMGCC